MRCDVNHSWRPHLYSWVNHVPVMWQTICAVLSHVTFGFYAWVQPSLGGFKESSVKHDVQALFKCYH